MVGGRLTRAALLLMGQAEAISWLRPAVAQISWFLKGAQGEDSDYCHFGLPLLRSSEETFARVRNLTCRYMPPGTLFPTEVPQYDAWVIREALHNCIVHQDYSLGGRINLVEKPDELIFANLGDFLPESVEAAVEGDVPPEHYRNRCLADAMFDLKMIDTRGGGIRRMFREQRERFFPLPDYTVDRVRRRVEVRIIGKLLDKKYTDALITRSDLSLHEVMLLDRLQKGRKLDTEAIRLLRARKLIEGRAPNLFISGSVAEITGQQPAYIRNRAFDDAYYMDMVINYLHEFGDAGRKQVDELLLGKLSDRLGETQKKRRVSYLLTKLRSTGRIRNAGSDAQPRWVLSNSDEVAPD
jgi:ATP-dependent DNA helicase RecG